jgi:hypothetical protein
LLDDAWYPALALSDDTLLAAWRGFRTADSILEPESIHVAAIKNGAPADSAAVATGHFHRAPRLLPAEDGWILLAIERSDGDWRLVQRDLDAGLAVSHETVLSPEGARVTSFDVVDSGGGAVIWTQAADAGRSVALRPLEGDAPAITLATGPVWTPAIAATPEGQLAAAWEERGRIRLTLLDPAGEVLEKELVVVVGRHLGHPALCAAGSHVYVTFQSNGTWGRQTERLNEDTRLHAFRWRPGGALEMGVGQPNGTVPIDTASRFDDYRSETPDNRKLPLAPSLLADAEGRVTVLFRHYRDAQMNDWGWTLRAVHGSGAGLGLPQNITTASGYPDRQYALAQAGDVLYAAVAEAEYPVTSRGFTDRRGTRPARVALYAVRTESAEGEPAWTPARPASRVAPMGGACRELPSLWRGRRLVWADLHRHTWESRCIPEQDADFLDHVRWARDVEELACVSFTDHWFYHGSNGEHRASLSATEVHAEPGRFAPLFGVEQKWSSTGHVNIYAPDRETMDHVDRMCRGGDASVEETLAYIHENDLEGRLMLVRHFHGMTFGEGPEQVMGNPLTAEAGVEPVIEVVQNRGHCLPWYCRMLRAGHHKGVVGGSDHCRAPDRKSPFCLTALWVDEVTVEGIWEALQNRRCYATNGARIELRLQAGEAAMGGTASPEAEVRWEAASERPLERVDVYRHGARLESISCDGALTAAGGASAVTGPEAASWFIAAYDVEGGFAISSPVWTAPSA